MATSFTIDVSGLTAAISRFEHAGTRFAAVVSPLVNAGLDKAVADIAGLLTGPVLKVRSGHARASVKRISAHVEGNDITGSVASLPFVPYLHFQYTRRTIVPRNAKNLAIPIGNALTPAGVPRYASPRQVPNLLFIPRTKAGNTILALRKPGGGLDPLFVLKKSVTIPPHDFLSQPAATLQATLQRQIPAALVAAVEQR